jgi:glutathione S-transferase
VLEKALACLEFLVTDHFTVADVNAATAVSRAATQNLALGPNVKVWLERMQARPAYQRAAAG